MTNQRCLQFFNALLSVAVLIGSSMASAQTVALVGAGFIDVECWERVAAPVPLPQQTFRNSLSRDQFLRQLSGDLNDPVKAMQQFILSTSVGTGGNAPKRYSLYELISNPYLAGGGRHRNNLDVGSCVLKMEQLPMYTRLTKLTEENRVLNRRVRDLEANYRSAADIATDLIARLSNAQVQLIALEEEIARLRASPLPAERAQASDMDQP